MGSRVQQFTVKLGSAAVCSPELRCRMTVAVEVKEDSHEVSFYIQITTDFAETTLPVGLS